MDRFKNVHNTLHVVVMVVCHLLKNGMVKVTVIPFLGSHRPDTDVYPGAADTQWDECSEDEIRVTRAVPGTGGCGEVWGGCP